MTKSPSQIRDDFDRVALSSAADDVAHPYDRMLIALVPPTCRRLLDLGCGTGRLTRAMAQRVEEVTAVDVSSEMLRVARERCAGRGNVAFVEADLFSLPDTLGVFDCVMSVNLLHHLPAEQAAQAMKAVLAPGGLLIVHDIRQTAGVFDRALDGPRVAVKTLWRLARVSRVRAFLRQRAAWAQHARGDVVSTAEEITLMRNRLFPGAVVRHHFLWRYTLLWSNGGAACPAMEPRRARGPMACGFQPGLALRFHKGRDSVQVLVCFLCRELVFEKPGGEWLDGKLTFSKTVQTRLLAVGKKAFPALPWPLARLEEPSNRPIAPAPTLPLARSGSSEAR